MVMMLRLDTTETIQKGVAGLPGVAMHHCLLAELVPDVPGVPDSVPDVPGVTDSVPVVPGVPESVSIRRTVLPGVPVSVPGVPGMPVSASEPTKSVPGVPHAATTAFVVVSDVPGATGVAASMPGDHAITHGLGDLVPIVFKHVPQEGRVELWLLFFQ